MPVICKMTEKLRVMSWFFRVSGSNVMCLCVCVYVCVCVCVYVSVCVCVDFFFCNRVIPGNAAKLVADTILSPLALHNP